MGLKRREFLKLTSLGLTAAGIGAQRLIPSPSARLASSEAPVRHLLDDDFPFPYDDQHFECAERIYNVRSSRDGSPIWKADLNLILRMGKRLDIKVLVSERLEGITTTSDIFSFSGVEDNLDLVLTGFESPRLFYQVLYREGSGRWMALSPKSFKLPNVKLDKGGEIQVVFLADDHTFDDGDYKLSEEYREAKLYGDYVNTFLKKLKENPHWEPEGPLGKLKNGFSLAASLMHILTHESPDFVIHLGDTTGIGANYRWEGFGLPVTHLRDEDYDFIGKTFWMRMRKLYSALTPHVPVFLVLGNHDGDEGWNPASVKARLWRQKLFPLPGRLTYPEGGHPDGNYYAFSWGSDLSNRGGVQFIVLDVTAFSGNTHPKKPEGWTLSQAQRLWLEDLLQKGEKDWMFACLHHVLGGWPAGPDESRRDIAYGRGPLFNPDDYGSFCDPAGVEQVKITELAREAGVRAFFYGHDHIFHVRSLGSGLNQKDTLGVCCGSTKHVAETNWWQGNYWRKHYGDGLKAKPDFWGPSGITRLAVKKDEARIDYLLTCRSGFSNIPSGAKAGEVLSSALLINPPPSLTLDRPYLSIIGREGERRIPDHTFRIKNSGSGLLHYRINKSRPWVSVWPDSGTSWGEWDEVCVSVNPKNLDEGVYEETIEVESPEAKNSPCQLKVQVKIFYPEIHPPLGFTAVRKDINFVLFRKSVIVLSWKPHPQNRRIKKYRIYRVNSQGFWMLMAEVNTKRCSYLFPDAQRSVRLGFVVTAVDVKKKEGKAAWAFVV